MMYILATTRTGHEFATADAINAMLQRPDPDGDLRPMGGIAIVPRKIAIDEATKATPRQPAKPRRYKPVPFAAKYLFLAVTPEQWHEIQTRKMYTPDGKLLPAPHRLMEINPIEWRGPKNGNGGCQGFFERAEAAYLRRVEQFERGEAVARYRKGDKLRILGDMATGQLRSQVAEFLRLDAKGRIIAQSVGLDLLGKPFTMTLDAEEVEAWAAE